MPALRLSLIDRYLLASMGPPMAVAFVVVLISLLLYRILEIFNLLAASGAQFQLVTQMIGALLPHYLGLALPAGFFISIFVVVSRMSDTSEVDALLASGMSMERLLAPFMAVAIVVVAASLLLFGFLQPHGRYDYNAGLNAALGSPWNARLQARTFLTPSDSFVISADRTDPSGRVLTGVFVRRVLEDGGEQVFTARQGRLLPSPDGMQVRLVLTDVRQLQDQAEGSAIGALDELELEAPGAAAVDLFRPRGEAARELTFPELWERMGAGETEEARRQAAAEFHARAVRAISPLFLPLLALPLGMASKRGRRGGGFVFAAVVFLLYQYAIDMTKAMADLDQISPNVGVWSPFFVFSTLCLLTFATSRERPGETPLTAVVDRLGEAMEAVQRQFRRRPRPA